MDECQSCACKSNNSTLSFPRSPTPGFPAGFSGVAPSGARGGGPSSHLVHPVQGNVERARLAVRPVGQLQRGLAPRRTWQRLPSRTVPRLERARSASWCSRDAGVCFMESNKTYYFGPNQSRKGALRRKKRTAEAPVAPNAVETSDYEAKSVQRIANVEVLVKAMHVTSNGGHVECWNNGRPCVDQRFPCGVFRGGTIRRGNNASGSRTIHAMVISAGQ